MPCPFQTGSGGTGGYSSQLHCCVVFYVSYTWYMVRKGSWNYGIFLLFYFSGFVRALYESTSTCTTVVRATALQQ